MNHRILTLCFLFLGASLLQGQDRADIRGTVLSSDGNKKQRVPNVGVWIFPKSNVEDWEGPIDSDGNGNFIFRRRLVGTYFLLAKHVDGSATCLTFSYSDLKKSYYVGPQCSGLEVTLSPLKKAVLLRGPILIALNTAHSVDTFSFTLPEQGPTSVGLPSACGDSEGNTVRGQVIAAIDSRPIANALVELDNLEHGNDTRRSVASARTTAEGCYSVSVIEPGTHVLRVADEGYAPVLLLLSVEQGDEGLQIVGADPTAQRPEQVNLQDSRNLDRIARLTDMDVNDIRSLFDTAIIRTLPLGGIRNLDDLALLAPGTLPPALMGGVGPGVAAGVGSSGQLSASGMRTRENNFTLDGADNNEESVGVRRQGFMALTPQPLDSIQELQVITALADSRYGRNLGAQVHALTRNGLNQWHSEIYGFLTDNRSNARNFFDLDYESLGPLPGASAQLDGSPIIDRPRNSAGKDPMTRTQAGITAGGPGLGGNIFGSYERQAIQGSRETHFAVPTVRERGVFGSGAEGWASPLGPSTPTSLPGDGFLSLFPFPNNTGGPYGDNTYTAQLPAGGDADIYAIKHDRQVGSKMDVAFRYSFSRDARTLPTTGEAIASTLRPDTTIQNAAAIVNVSPFIRFPFGQTIRVSFGRSATGFEPIRDGAFLPSQLFPEDQYLLNRPLILNRTLPSSALPTYVSAQSPAGTSLLGEAGLLDATSSEIVTGPLGQVSVAGYSSLGYDTLRFPQYRVNKTYEIADTFGATMGSQTFSFGFDIRKVRLDSQIERGFRPHAVFNGVTAQRDQPDLTGATLAAMGTPTGMLHTLAVIPTSSLGLYSTQANFFFSDSWAPLSRLQVTFGVRWEVNAAPGTDGHQFERAFDPNTLRERVAPAEAQCAANPQRPDPTRCVGLADALVRFFPPNYRVAFNADRYNILPRLGLAWDPVGRGDLVLRAGFGAYAGQFPGIVK